MSDLELLNREQQEAVLHVDGPLLILDLSRRECSPIGSLI